MDKLTLKTLQQQSKDRLWSVKQMTKDSLDLYIYGEIEPSAYNFWTGEETESKTSQEHFRQVLEDNPGVEQINLYVNSQGGSVLEAMGIRALLKRHQAKVTAYVDGWAASAASFILTAADEVKMYAHSMQMLHNMWVVAAGNSKELRSIADELDKLMEGNRQAYLEKAAGKLEEKQLAEIMDQETWLTASECMELGLCDEIIQSEAPEDDKTPPEDEKKSLEPEASAPEVLNSTTQEQPPDCNKQQKEEAQQADSETPAPNGAIFMRAFRAALERTSNA